MGKYDYLKKYVNQTESSLVYPCNWFCSVSAKDIEEVEQKIGFELPSALKEFWLEIGGGGIEISKGGIAGNLVNRILYPYEVLSILADEDSPYISYDYRLNLLKNFIPIFEVADTSSFYFMRSDIDNKEAICDIRGEMIESSLKKFIWKLYHESPTYYLNTNESKKAIVKA